MKKLVRFHYVNVDGNNTNVDILALIDKWTDGLRRKIDDAIAFYIDTTEDWQYEELVCDVLSCLGLDYEIVSPTTFYI